MSDLNVQLNQAENALRQLREASPDPPQDIDIIFKHEHFVRNENDELIRVADPRVFPQDYRVTSESTEPDGSIRRIWKPKASN